MMVCSKETKANICRKGETGMTKNAEREFFFITLLSALPVLALYSMRIGTCRMLSDTLVENKVPSWASLCVEKC